MASKYCPDCKGSGFVVKHAFMIPCILCKANELGNGYLTVQDLRRPSYAYSWVLAESSDVYWEWLRDMVQLGHIDTTIKPKLERDKRKGKR